MALATQHYWYEPHQESDETQIQERTQDRLETSLYGNLDSLVNGIKKDATINNETIDWEVKMNVTEI